MKVEKVLVALIAIVLIATAVIFGVKMSGGESDEPVPATLSGTGDVPLVVVGVRGLELSMVERLVAEGRLPNLARLVAGGATGRFATLGRHVDYRIVWTSLVTGMLPENQGVGGKRLSHRGEMVDAPLMPKARTVGALWTHLEEAGQSSGVISWPGTWPVEEIEGVMVGPLSTYVLERGHGGNPDEAIFPPSQQERLNPMVLDREHFKRRDLSRFINVESAQGLEALVGQNYIALAGACAEDRSAVDLATALARGGDARNLFVCLAGTDVVSQRFWHYMETEAIENVDVSEDMRRLLDGQIEALGNTVELYYDYIDELIGELAALAGNEGTVVVVADHGYGGIPLDAGGSPIVGSAMHSEEGILIASGPRVAAGVNADIGKLIDVAPTIMAAAGLAVPDDLDGKAHEEMLSR